MAHVTPLDRSYSHQNVRTSANSNMNQSISNLNNQHHSSLQRTNTNNSNNNNSNNNNNSSSSRHTTPPIPTSQLQSQQQQQQASTSSNQSPFPFPPSAAHSNPPPPLSLLSLGSSGPPPPQGPSVLQILAMGQERNHAADSLAHHPRVESLIKLGKESEATWLQIGATAETLGDLDRATVSYESALRHNAYSIVALSQIAAICRSKEEFKKAAEYFGRVVDIAPESGDVWGALGHCYLMIDDLKKAYSSYQQALYYMSNPQEPKLWYGIGILYDRYGSLEHAEEAFSSVIRMDPTFEKANEIFFRLGIIYKQQRKSAQSLECFRYILQNPPRPLTEIDIWFQIGHVYEQQKDYLAAKESYERVLAENPSHAKVLQQLGGLYHRSRAPFYNPELSVTILTKSLESDANDPFSWYLLGRAYMTTNNFGKAYEAYQQAVYRDGKNPAFWCSIGVLYYNINQFHDALDAYSRAIRIHPYLAEVWFNLGALYESCNDQMTDAIDAYQRTIQLDPSNAIVGARLREIQNHQSTGAALSPPPTPKDISPSSLSWNYATNAGGTPTHPSGLGVELSPALSRAGGAGSPSTGHRFEGPLSNGMGGGGGGRPRSTDSYRNDLERRRQSGGALSHHSPSASMEQSPPSLNHRQSGPPSTNATSNSLPQIKSHDSTQEISTIRNSPASQRHSDIAPDNSYPPHHSLPAHFNQNAYPRGTPSENDMDWERSHRGPSVNTSSRLGSSSGRPTLAPPLSQQQSQQSFRRSPPNSSHSRDSRDPRDSREQQPLSRDYHTFNNNNSTAPPPPPPGFERHFASPGSGSNRPLASDERDLRGGGPTPSVLPSAYSTQPFPPYGQYPLQQQQQQQQQQQPTPFYDPITGRRLDPREKELEEDERRRNPTVVALGPRNEGTPIRPPSVTRAREERESSTYSNGSNTPGTPITAPIPAKGRGGRSTKPRGTSITPAKVPTSRSRKPKESVETSPPAAKRRGTKLEGSVAPPPAKKPRGRAITTGTPIGRDNSPTVSSPNPNPSQGLSREVDEDYDDGVDALMGLATAHEHSPSVPSPSLARTEETNSLPNLSPLEGGNESSKTISTDEEKVEEENEISNPRKRSLTSPTLELDSKRTKTDTIESEVEAEVNEVIKQSNGVEEVVAVVVPMENESVGEVITAEKEVNPPQESKIIEKVVEEVKLVEGETKGEEEIDELVADDDA